MMTTSLFRVPAACAALVLVAVGAVSCGLDKQTAPALAGPSEFGLSLSVRAFPDTLVADGESQAAIQVTARDPNGQPVPGVTIALEAIADRLIVPQLTQSTIVTGANGIASAGLVAPAPPATQFAVDPIVTVSARPIGTDFANSAPRQVQVTVRAPEGTPRANRAPTAVIVANPPVANFNETIHFDGSLSTDEGVACNGNCEYIWEFGDNTVAVKGMGVDHVFTLPGTYTVTLTVTDGSLSDTDSFDVRIIGPTAVTADFTVTPASPSAGASVTFNASSSTVGQGATIAQYAWNFGDNSATVTSSSATTSHTFALAGSYDVTLTVTDSLGRQSVKTATVDVQ